MLCFIFGSRFPNFWGSSQEIGRSLDPRFCFQLFQSPLFVGIRISDPETKQQMRAVIPYSNGFCYRERLSAVSVPKCAPGIAHNRIAEMPLLDPSHIHLQNLNHIEISL
jgi:hypothetical protein